MNQIIASNNTVWKSTILFTFNVELYLRCQELINEIAAVFFNGHLVKLLEMEIILFIQLFFN